MEDHHYASINFRADNKTDVHQSANGWFKWTKSHKVYAKFITAIMPFILLYWFTLGLHPLVVMKHHD